MILQGLALFLLEASAGTSMLLFFFPHRILGKGFFTLHGLIALCALAAAALLGPADRTAVISLVALAGYTLFARAGWQAQARPLLALSAASQLFTLFRLCRALGGTAPVWIFANAFLGALLFGSALLTMNLGHWYLVSRSLPKQLLFRAAVGFTALCAARMAFAVLVAILRPDSAGWDSLTSLDRDALFYLFRVLWGILGPAALSYFVFQTARMRSNQAATGLLYVALIFVLIGEILSSGLTVLTKSPA
jgi:hypothetical protein